MFAAPVPGNAEQGIGRLRGPKGRGSKVDSAGRSGPQRGYDGSLSGRVRQLAYLRKPLFHAADSAID